MRVLHPPHAHPAQDVARELRVDMARGVPPDEVDARRAAFGANVLVRDAGRSPWRILGKQFASLIVLLLAIAAGVAFATRDAAEGVAIVVVLLVNAAIGFLVEWQSERALRKLRLQAETQARVVRDGRESIVAAEDLVVGDVLVLEAGAHTPADARLVEAASLAQEESALTGESIPVEKDAGVIDAEAPLPDRKSMVYLGTWTTMGRGRAIVTAVGENTELGRIGQLVRASHDEATPLERQLAALGRRLVHLVLVIAAIVIAAGVARGEPLWSMIEFGISLAVAAVPEGLPAVTTLILAVGVLRMAKRHAIVRRLPAVETLGSTTVICTDKTGTLTMNRLTVREIVAEDRVRLLRAAVLCNDATETTGDPTERALVVAATEAGIDVAALRREWPRESEEAFSHETKRMITTHRSPDGRQVRFMKGAPPPSTENERLASRGLRVLAVTEDDALLGLVGMDDPPRPGAAEAIAEAHAAGVRVVMLTGDQLHTANAIAKELNVDQVFARVSPEDKLKIVDRLREEGEIVAVTGDGVNDAPALRRADIGVAMGRSGTDAAKQSGDLILTDDNLGTIVHAIEQGRTIYANIRRFVHLMFSHNLGEVLTVVGAIVFALPLPLLPLQILWINLVTDVFPAFGLAMEPASRETMDRPSRAGTLLRRDFVILIAWQGTMLAALTFGAYVWALDRYGAGSHARTVALFALVAVQIGHTFNCRSRMSSAFRGVHRNPYLWGAVGVVIGLQWIAYRFLPRLLDLAPLTRDDMAAIATCVVMPVIVVEAQKYVVRRRMAGRQDAHPKKSLQIIS